MWSYFISFTVIFLVIICSNEISSTLIRNSIKERKAFERFLASEVEVIIKQEG
jgi:nicotinic acid mononucleotide adenylyltransferase